ncbi:MAG TPA: ABC transporter substrate-binding protein [Candidatus Acidoferrales bacterium]|nr:ABC transporter substrate-binding protein [Candidatus Acidoferrales bacterium]
MTPQTALRWAALAGLAAVLAACGGTASGGAASAAKLASATNRASAPGITANSISIGSTQPLTGVAAPGYDEIAPASEAYFKYVNAHGGVFGRKIKYTYLDDGYNPSQTPPLTRQLVLQDNVFAIYSALGTPTHLSVVKYLNAEKVPDLFVSSGCDCWNEPSAEPWTFGWQPDYTIEGKILGQYVKQKLSGQKVGYFYQDDEFGLDGVKGLDTQIPASSLVSRQDYVTTNTAVGPQIAALQQAGAQVVVSFSVPAFTALALLTAATLNYHPTWVVSNVGSDPPTLAGLLSSFSKGAAGGALVAGMISDAYAPLVSDSSNPWIKLFKGIVQQYAPSLPWDGNVLYGVSQAYTLVQTLKAAGRNPTRASLVKTLETKKLTGGPGLVPLDYSKKDHLGFQGVEVVKTGANGSSQTAVSPIYVTGNTGKITVYKGKATKPPSSGVPSN